MKEVVVVVEGAEKNNGTSGFIKVSCPEVFVVRGNVVEKVLAPSEFTRVCNRPVGMRGRAFEPLLSVSCTFPIAILLHWGWPWYIPILSCLWSPDKTIFTN